MNGAKDGNMVGNCGRYKAMISAKNSFVVMIDF